MPSIIPEAEAETDAEAIEAFLASLPTVEEVKNTSFPLHLQILQDEGKNQNWLVWQYRPYLDALVWQENLKHVVQNLNDPTLDITPYDQIPWFEDWWQSRVKAMPVCEAPYYNPDGTRNTECVGFFNSDLYNATGIVHWRNIQKNVEKGMSFETAFDKENKLTDGRMQIYEEHVEGFEQAAVEGLPYGEAAEAAANAASEAAEAEAAAQRLAEAAAADAEANAAAQAAADAAAQEKETVCSAFNRLCDEEPEHYVERYITEPEYKAWFDKNFPDYTIYEGIGITQSQYQKIVNDLTKPQPVAEQETTTVQKSTTKESGGNEIIYVLVAAVAVGGGIGAVFIIKKGSNAPKPVQQELPSRRQTTVLFCGKCGNSLKPGARFCGMCGNPHS